MTRRMRTNAGKIQYISGNRKHPNISWDRKAHKINVILDYYQDVHDGVDSMLDLLWATQILRAAYDSTRIGGGIDPEIAHLGSSSVETERMEEGSFIQYLYGTEEYHEPWTQEHSTEEIQDMIVHAEAVALLWLSVFEAKEEA